MNSEVLVKFKGDTKDLDSATKGARASMSTLQTELRNLNSALKINPKSIELLTQKQDVLKKMIEATTNKLNDLNKEQSRMGDYNSLTEEQKKKYRELSIEITKTKDTLNGLNGELDESSKKSINFGAVAKGAASVAATAFAAATAAISSVGSAMVKITKQSVGLYAEYEQLVGGVETLFAESEKEIKEFEKFYGKTWEELQNAPEGFLKTSDQLLVNARQAYKTAGVSANEYMNGVNSFAASLLQATGKNSWEAMEIADMAFQDMSDNANKMGTSMQSIQNAYQGFAKQNYTINLMSA